MGGGNILTLITITGEFMTHYDLIVIGSGPAGQKAAVQAAKLGKRVAIIDRMESMGGSASIPAPFRAKLSKRRCSI